MVDSLLPKEELNSQFWSENKKLNPEVRKQLLLTARNFKQFLNLEDLSLQDKLKLIDIRFTGSLAQYTWSQYSDVDLHLVFDFSSIEQEYLETTKQYLQARKALWNAQHDVTIHGYDVEIYPEDVVEKHIAAGLYSIAKDEWINKPVYKSLEADRNLIKQKVQGFLEIMDILGQEKLSPEDLIKSINKLKDKIKKMRQAGLAREGEQSIENLVFKVLRRIGMLDNLENLKTSLVDSNLSL